MIIDFHTHTFPSKIAARVLDKLQHMSRSMPYTQGTADDLRASMAQADIDLSILLPVMTNTEQVAKLNEAAAHANEHWQETGLLSFGGIHPDTANYREELSHIQAMGLRGIKLHPAYQSADFDDLRYLRIIDRASELGLIVLTHAGWDIGIPQHNYCTPKQIRHVMREVAPDKLVLAHMGGWADWSAVERDLSDLPVYFDTAFSTGDIAAAPGTKRLPEESHNLSQADFVRMVHRHGADRILFATDSPWSDQSDTLAFFRTCGLTEQELNAVLGGNAQNLLQLS